MTAQKEISVSQAPKLYDAVRECEVAAANIRTRERDMRRMAQGLSPNMHVEGAPDATEEYRANAMELAARVLRAVMRHESEVRDLIARLDSQKKAAE